ncbi:MAG: AAA family ATPase [Desulfosporosinus sp.]|nr:AAA family ATPase [Desulfosporosinus sp.]
MDSWTIQESPYNMWLSDGGIRRIFVDGLFGRYRYDLSEQSSQTLASRVLLLYGDNGTGKTTILRILFFLLSHIDKVGHKAQLKKIRFKTFQVDFANGTSVIAARDDFQQTGYVISILQNSTLLARAQYFSEDEDLNSILSRLEPHEFMRRHQESQKIEENHQKVLTALSALDLRMIYVTDKRRIFTTVPGAKEQQVQRRRQAQRSLFDEDDATNRAEEPLSISAAVEQIGSWATTQALRLSSQGEDDVNAVYAKIIEKLASAGREPLKPDLSLAQVMNELASLEKRSYEFQRFGLSQPLKLEPLSKSLTGMSETARKTALVVMRPYIESLRARFEALDPIRIQLLQFVEILTSFYKQKNVSLTVGRGLRINVGNEAITPSMLSSGEGQLLFILASTLMAKERSGLFMVDEPEISLNVVWQRKLLQALLEITAGKRIQFLMATHSVELLTRYSDLVLNLNKSAENG